MRPGRLRHFVTIQTASTTADAYGDEVESFADAETVWASIEPLNGRELYEAQQVHPDASVRIRMWYHPEVTPNSKIIWDSHTFEVLSVINREEQNVELELMCREAR